MVVDACDRDKDGSVDYNEFLRFLRVIRSKHLSREI